MLTNGFEHTAKLDVGTLDTWTFQANADDGVFVRMGNTSTNGTLDPYLRLYGPDGKLLAQNGGYGYIAEDVAIQAPTNG